MSNSSHFSKKKPKYIIKLNLELVTLLSLLIYVIRYHPRITNISEPPGRTKNNSSQKIL